MQTKTNTNIFGWKPLLRLYVLTDDSTFEHKLSGKQNWVQKDFAELPAYYDAIALEKDIENIKNFYFSNGYFKMDIVPTITQSKDSSGVSIELAIHEGKPYQIDRLTYDGIEFFSPEKKSAFYGEKNISIGENYSVLKLQQERNRIVGFFQNEGCYLMHIDSVSAIIDTANYHCGISFSIHPSEKLKFGDIRVHINRDMAVRDSVIRSDTIDNISYHFYTKEMLATSFLQRNMLYRPKQNASQLSQVKTIQQIYGTGLFENPSIVVDSIHNEFVFTTLGLKLFPKHSFQFRPQIDSRYNTFSFLSFSIIYSNKNLFGNGEILNISATAGVQAIQLEGRSTLPYTFDATIEFLTSYFIFINNRFRITGNFSQNNIFSDLTRTYTFSLQSIYTPASFIALYFTLFELEVLNTNNLRISNTTNTPSLNLHTIFRFETYISNLYNKERTFSFKANFMVEESGLLANLYDLYIDHSNPGTVFGVAYSQYLKFRATASFFFKFNSTAFFKVGIRGGYMFSYGSVSTSTPFYRRFYSGGPNSIRAWGANSLGPGYLINQVNVGGDIQMESSVEFSQYFLSTSSFQLGFACFGDAGNVWDREGANSFGQAGLDALAIGAGIGLRLSTLIGVVQLDFAYPIREPNTAAKWISNFDISRTVINLTISEAF